MWVGHLPFVYRNEVLKPKCDGSFSFTLQFFNVQGEITGYSFDDSNDVDIAGLAIFSQNNFPTARICMHYQKTIITFSFSGAKIDNVSFKTS
jgi:hypothetical protein